VTRPTPPTTDPAAGPGQVAVVAEQLLALTLSRPATLGPGRLLCIDGPAGSGKSTLAAAIVALAARHGSVGLVHMDDLLDGWRGLARAVPRVARDLVGPLREGRPGSYLHYDWLAARFTGTRVVAPVDLLVVEGVGSGSTAYDDVTTLLVWVEAPRALRFTRGMQRDGDDLRETWLTWMADEDELHARERTRDRADVLVDGTGEAAPVLRQRAGRSST